MNAFHADKMLDEEADALLSDLLVLSETEFGHERKTVEHPNRLLWRYFYKKCEGRKDSMSENNSSELTSDTNVSDKKHFNGLGDEKIEIKMESAEHKALKELVAALKSGIVSLTRKICDATNVSFTLKNTTNQVTLDKCVADIETFVKELRVFTFSDDIVEAVQAEPTELAPIVAKANKYKQLALTHLDGLKAKIRVALKGE